jgi:hypothetical protein
MRTSCAVLASAILVGSAPLTAQTIMQPNEQIISSVTTVARKALPMAVLPDGSNVPEERPEELAHPIVPAALDAQTVQRGMLSAEMALCDLDWTAVSFRPYMNKLRSSGRYSDKQLAYVGLLHGLTMQFTANALAPYVRGCTKGSKRQLTRMADVQELQLP